MSNFTMFIQHSTGSPSHRSQTRIKSHQIEKKEVKLSLFVDDMILHRENSKRRTQKLLELINEFSKMAGYKNKYSEISCIFIHQ